MRLTIKATRTIALVAAVIAVAGSLFYGAAQQLAPGESGGQVAASAGR